MCPVVQGGTAWSAGTAGQAGTRATEVQPRATPVTSSRGACVLRTACCRDGDVVFVVVVVLPSRLLHPHGPQERGQLQTAPLESP